MINDRLPHKKEDDNVKTDMVMISRADAEWLTTWRERCENGAVAMMWSWRALLAFLGLIGAIGLAINQWASIVRKFSGT